MTDVWRESESTLEPRRRAPAHSRPAVPSVFLHLYQPQASGAAGEGVETAGGGPPEEAGHPGRVHGG